MYKQEIIDKKFSRAFHGYDVAEVDYFLDEVYRELSFRDREEESLHAQIETLRAELEALKADIPETEELCFLESPAQDDMADEQREKVEESEPRETENAKEQDL